MSAININMAVFWVLVPRSLAQVYQRFRGLPDDGSTTEMLANSYQTTWRYNTEHGHL